MIKYFKFYNFIILFPPLFFKNEKKESIMGNIFKTTHSRVMQLSYSDFSGKSVKNFLSNLHFIMGLGEKVK